MGNTSRPSFFVPVLVVILFLVFMTHCSMTTDALSLGQSLSGSQILISKGGRFELGFFSPGLSRNYYISIWFKEVPEQTVVWVANRQAPLPDASSELKISEKDENLVLMNRTDILAWSSYSTSTISSPTVAVLLDSGNLVLGDSSNSSIMIRQSFDQPTDTLLPDARIGLHKVTGQRLHLISWKNSEDPALAAYSMQVEEDGTGRYFMQSNESRRYWSSGVWDGSSFGVLDCLDFRDMSSLPITLNSSYVTNKNENSATYYFEDNSTIARGVMESSGQFNLWIWSKAIEKWVLVVSLPRDQCEVYNVCGSFGVCNENSSVICTCLPAFRPLSRKDWEKGDWSGGCVREVDLSCIPNRSIIGRSEEFMIIPNFQLPSDPQSLTVKGGEECQKACLGDCSCTAYAYNTSGCYQWSGDPLNLRQPYSTDVAQDLYLPLAVSRADKGIITGVVVACGFSFVVSLTVVLMLSWRRHRKLHLHASPVLPGSLVTYRYRDLKNVTNNFREKLGGVSFGSVFKGALPDSSLVAVKKLEGHRQGEKQFLPEVSTIGMIQHVNLVRLGGFCFEGSKRLLLYDWMPNGSLDLHLFEKNSKVLDWKTPYQIALGIAKRLAYLHEKCRECILHCDSLKRKYKSHRLRLTYLIDLLA